ncbi:hypothetical protein [Streptomyces sp. NPDC093225]|uniref:hypothetical protein n=1 Tax=Streptomyces sp. NPDC093225 TaxID=3366034 RepID=UPI003821CC6D
MTSDITCSHCHRPTEEGWLVMWNPLMLLNFVNWQPARPGYVRFRRPKGSEKVIVPRAGGKGCPRARICRPCKSVTFSYAEHRLD